MPPVSLKTIRGWIWMQPDIPYFQLTFFSRNQYFMLSTTAKNVPIMRNMSYLYMVLRCREAVPGEYGLPVSGTHKAGTEFASSESGIARPVAGLGPRGRTRRWDRITGKE